MQNSKLIALKWAGRISTENRYEVVKDGAQHESDVLSGAERGKYYNMAYCAKNIQVGEFVALSGGNARRIAKS